MKYGRVIGPSGIGKSSAFKSLLSHLNGVQFLDLRELISVSRDARILIIDHAELNFAGLFQVIDFLKSGQRNNIQIVFVIGQQKRDSFWGGISSHWDCEIVFESPYKITMQVAERTDIPGFLSIPGLAY